MAKTLTVQEGTKVKRLGKVQPPTVKNRLDPKWYDTVDISMRLAFKNSSRRAHVPHLTAAREAAQAAFVASLEANGYEVFEVESEGHYGYTKAI